MAKRGLQCRPDDDAKPRKKRPLLEVVDSDGGGGGGGGSQGGAAAGSGESKFARALGSTDFQTREKGLLALGRWLASRGSVPELDLLKLWKGVFYCFWHSDKAPVQDDLARRLSGMMQQLKPQVALLFFRTFLKTIRREWMGIDRLRLDKFLLLIRYFIREMMVILKKSNWDISMISQYMEVLEGGCLLPSDTLPAAGVAYHLADIYVDEIDTALADDRPPPSKVLEALLEPFLQAAAKCQSQPLLHRIKDGVFLRAAERYENGNGAMASLDAPALAEKIFHFGAEHAVNHKNRVALYELNKTFEKAIKRAGRQDRQVGDVSLQDTEKILLQKDETQTKRLDKKATASKSRDAAQNSGPTVSTSEEQATASAADTVLVQPVKKRKVPKPSEKEQKKSLHPATPNGNLSSAKKRPKGDSANGVSTGTPTPKSNGVDPMDVASGSLVGKTAEKALQSPKSSTLSTPTGPGEQGNAPSTGKKTVRFSMKRNLYFHPGKPPPAVDVRTPPPSRPRGPAIKRTSSVGPKSKATPKSTKRHSLPRTPRSAPRPSASDFF